MDKNRILLESENNLNKSLGTIMLKNGCRYQGNLKSGVFHGRGILSWPEGDKYQGDFVEGEQHGKGVFTWSNGDKYEGDFVNGARTGKGVFIWSDGEQYEGDFIDGERTGKGKYTWVDGTEYKGDFINGEFNGNGIFLRSDGDKYEGNFKNGLFDGKGVYTWDDGTRYVGNFSEGEFNGKGLYIWKSGDKYEGDFIDGKRTGRGFLVKANKDKYEGEFFNDEFNGNGLYIWADGDSYKGEFVAGKKHGKGILRTSDGEIIEGNWENDKFLDGMNEKVINMKNVKNHEATKEDINKLIGLKGVKENIKELSNLIRTYKLREEQGLTSPMPSLHLVFTGNPGTGKTTVARIIGSIYKDLGLLKKGHVVEVDRSDLVGKFMGETENIVKEVVESALDGVLFIDEAYSLYRKDSTNDYGKEVIDILLKLMEDNRENLVVIVAGYKKEMNEFLKSNPGIKSRFNNYINFEDYSTYELLKIMEKICTENSYILVENAKKQLIEVFEKEKKSNRNFANARFVRNTFEKITKVQSNRILQINNPNKNDLMLILEEDIIGLKKNNTKSEETLESLLSELNSYTGLESVKKDVNTVINLLRLQKMRKENGIKTIELSMHLVFTGNPGTGKTTIARLLGRIYKKLGLLSKGHFIETDRSDLVGQYLGQTSKNVVEKVNEALGGILFIDEAYSLYKKDSPNDYGREAIDTLLKLMEDNRENLVVIVAGYNDEMDEFLESNPGLRSRFNKFIKFEDYDARELKDILMSLCDKNKFTLTIDAELEMSKYFVSLVENKTNNFANGRTVRNIFEELIKIQANRLASQGFSFENIAKLQEINFDDVSQLIGQI